ncbi:hypothetical protein NTCA1_45790 [Novosphingobium sp. TCA1]|nr:hypothetical protein NTCA1_45790 [Novosphingobium sp. TCA1]
MLRYIRDLARGERLNVMIGKPQHAVPQADRITSHMNRKDLSASVAGVAAAVNIAVDQEAAVLCPITIANDVFSAFYLRKAMRESSHH